MKELIVLNGVSGVELSITTAAHALKLSALSTARAVGHVTDTETQNAAVAAESNIAGILKQMEANRVEVKAPVIALGKRIDQIAADFCKELANEKTRLHSGIQANFRNEQERAAMEKRLADRVADMKRAKAEAEAKAIADAQAKIAAAALSATTQEQAERLDAEARELAVKAEVAADKVDEIAPVATEAPARSEKMVVKTIWKHRITDIALLYAARPELCNVEPRTNVINAEVRGGMRECPGIEVWEETDVTVRA